jgi:hypothetical protein
LGFRIRGPGSTKNLFKIPESTRYRIPNPDPQHCYLKEKKFDERSVPTTRRHWDGRKIWLVRAGESITSFKKYLDVNKMY